MKWLKAIPQKRIERIIPERPLFHACSGNDVFGDVRIDFDLELSIKPDVYGDVRALPIKDDCFGAAFIDAPWTAAWKKNVADAMKELLRVAPVVYVLSPWTYGSKICTITDIYIAWSPGVNQTLTFIRYERN